MEVVSSASSSRSSNFDVFLNFRGEDTRKSFTGFLHKALKDRGINVFIDNEKLWTGEAIGPALLRAIEGSKISIPIFSKGYASSKWCLLELSHILHCHRSNGQMVLPIFLDVEPSHVRNQTGSLDEPFRKHEKNFKPHIKSWREALRVVGNLKGWVLKEDVNGDQPELVELVVKRVFDELSRSTRLAECRYPVGIDSHVNNMLSLLNIGSNDVQYIGICGFGGIGKTSIAKAVYNHIFSKFHRHSFLDVGEQAIQFKGLTFLQNWLLKDTLNRDFHIHNHHMGNKLIEQSLCEENVLLVLDDVDSREQVEALVGELSWFGPGSRIIITTRDEHILNVAKVDKDKIYKPQVLDHMESLQLFSFHAFSMSHPPEDYIQLSHDVACYSGGLPLTLEVLGSYLSDINDKEVWESTLQKLKEMPHEKVQRRLKISYDNLEDDYQKAIFLDAACFFIGWEKETVISVWEACGYYPKAAIHRLIKRSLVRFDRGFDKDGECSKYYLKMHDQIRDMGREIVLEENLLEPDKRSRLWSHNDICDVLGGHKGTDMIKGMILPSDLPGVCLDSKHFEMMSNLRFLDISSAANFNGKFLCFPSALRWLRWNTCPWDILPTNFYNERLVHLDLSLSHIKQAWNIRPQDENKLFQKLRILNLSNCEFLSTSPVFSWFPHLEQLNLGNCGSLDKLDESIGQLSTLKSLILMNCWNIKELPESIGDLKYLVELQLSGSGIEKLPNGVGLLEKLEVLYAQNCPQLRKLPRSVRRMRCLLTMNLINTSISKFPDDFSQLPNLLELKISPKFIMPVSMKRALLPRELPDTYVELEYLPELPSSLVELHCDGCHSLVRLPEFSRLKNLQILSLSRCEELKEIQGLEGIETLEELDARECYNLTFTPQKILGQGTLLPFRSRQDRYSLTVNDGINNKGLILCLVLEFPSKMVQVGAIDLDISAFVYQKDRITRCYHTLRIVDIKLTTGRDVIYIHHFKGFDWFGIPLQGKDAIEILDVRQCTLFDWDWIENPALNINNADPSVKFWKVLLVNREADQQKPDQQSSAMMVADFFNWSYTSQAAEGEGSNSVPKELEDEEMVADFFNWSYTSQAAEGEGSNSVPKELEDEETELTSSNEHENNEAPNDGSYPKILDHVRRFFDLFRFCFEFIVERGRDVVLQMKGLKTWIEIWSGREATDGSKLQPR